MVSTGKRNNYRGPDIRLFVRDVRDKQGKKRPLEVRSWSTIKDVKDVLQQKIRVPPNAIRLYFGPLLTSGKELPNHRTLHDVGIYRSGETLLLDIKNGADKVSGGLSSSSSPKFGSPRKHTSDVRVSTSMLESAPKHLHNLVAEARRGLSLGYKPDFILEGSGGTYFMHDPAKNKIAVFKPADEEPYAENNPRGYLRQPGHPMGLREGIEPGESCMREVAAFLLDKDGFSGVPPTTLVEARHPVFNTNGARLNVSQGGAAIGSHSIATNSPVKPALMKKAGSFQEFVKSECSMDDISPSKISVEEVHKIAILDIRLMNADRNSANLLVRRKPDNTLELVPIDHGYCLRSVCDVSWMDWVWLDWPQLKEPVCDAHKKLIEELDIEADAEMLREQLNICEEAVDYFRASSALLKAGVAAGLTLYDIAVLCCRNDNLAEEPSMMEKLFDMAADLAHVAVENERWHHSAASRAIVEQLCPARPSTSVADFFGRSAATTNRKRLVKAISSGELGSLEDQKTRSLLAEAVEDTDETPGMAQSSQSDTSSDSGYCTEDKDLCSQWAENIVVDLEERQILPMVPMVRPERSGSVTSSDDGSSDDGSNLSSTPEQKAKFWAVAPGSAKAAAARDDGSVQWSPKSESKLQMELVGSLEPPLTAGSDHSRNNEKAATPKVTFGGVETVSFVPPATVDVTGYKSELAEGDEFSSHKPDTIGGMPRSKSYTALSVTSGRASKIVETHHFGRGKVNPKDLEHYRKYFHKFIDLVIVRETTAALHTSKHAAATM